MIRTWQQHAAKLTVDVVLFTAIYMAGAFILVHLAAEGEL